MNTQRKIEKGVLSENVNLAGFTSWQVGGDAERFYWPLDLADLQRFLKTLPANEPITWLGLGSNVLINDSGLKGTVIVTQGALKQMELLDATTVYAQAGVSCAQVSRFSAKNNLVKGEFLAGIPGTVGGALFMNAGSFGGETWERVLYVDTINRHGDIKRRYPNEFQISYRTTVGLGKDEWFVGAAFGFEPGNGEVALATIKEMLAKRAQTQPTGEPSCGSVFRNPKPQFSGQLIESLGLKGFQVGRVQVSPKHANFFVNLGGATAQDIVTLIQTVKQKVRDAYGIELHEEVRYLGF